MALTKGKIEFKGNFGDYFLKSVALFILSACTFGRYPTTVLDLLAV